MEILRKKINKINIEIVNTCGDTKSGFYHKSELYINGWKYSTNRINYLNRTWEYFTYQTSIIGCLNLAYNDIFKDYIEEYKKDNNKIRITQKEKESIKKDMEKNSNFIIAILKAKKLLKYSNKDFKKSYYGG